MDIKYDIDIKEEYEPEIGCTELLVETVNPLNKTNHVKSICIWSNEETKKLVELYKTFMNDIGPFNRFKRKKDMWLEMSAQIGGKSAKQCEERYKTILRRKKRVTEKVYLSEAKRKSMDLEDEDSEINIQNPNINIEDVDFTASRKDVQANFDNKDSRQCEQPFNTILRRKKAFLTKHFTTKGRRKTIDIRPRYAIKGPSKNNEEDIIMNNDDLSKPLENQKEECDEQPKTSNVDANDYEELSLSQTLMKIAAQKEEGKERRHMERMEVLTNMQDMLQQILIAKKK